MWQEESCDKRFTRDTSMCFYDAFTILSVVFDLCLLLTTFHMIMYLYVSGSGKFSQLYIQFSFSAIMEHWNIAIQKAFVVAIGLWVAFAKSGFILLALQVFANVIVQYNFYFFSYLFKSMGT